MLCPCPGSSHRGTGGDSWAVPASLHIQTTAAVGTWEQQEPQGCGYPPFLAWEGAQAVGVPLSQQGNVRGTEKTSLDWGWQIGSGTVPTMIPS